MPVASSARPGPARPGTGRRAAAPRRRLAGRPRVAVGRRPPSRASCRRRGHGGSATAAPPPRAAAGRAVARRSSGGGRGQVRRAASRSRNWAAVGRSAGSASSPPPAASISAGDPAATADGPCSVDHLRQGRGARRSASGADGRPAGRTGWRPASRRRRTRWPAAVEHLRRRVRRGQRLHRHRQLRARLRHRRQPEVGQPGVAVRVDQDVRRLHVAVDHAAGVGGGQGVGDPHPDVADPLAGGRFSG